ncbi:RraA family protein [Pseudomonas sp. FSL R10-0399]|uniref:RraA family protein n=1 Tax=Pseudomonas sp. FSL R10-0399 TaxID=2662194 RepID=UPI001295A9AE|nr:RraA family protein [Pseudomonas sp. FSL R10-0399]MQT56319.1 RraA family protein [Pseudomonas sp. FSL R10-0399]
MKPLCLLDRLAALDTNTVSDALDFLGIKGATAGLRPLWNCPKIVGRASTVLLGPKGDNLPTVHLITPVVERIDSDDRVLVIAGGLEGISCWGDTLANAAVSKRVRGTVIDGFSRDIDGNASIGYPVFGRGVTMISARNRVVQIDSAVTITVAGVEVSEDDYVIADNCGTVFVPQASIQQVVTIGERITRRQNAMVDAIRAGRSVAEVMHDSQFDAINAEHAQ